ncbi:MAG TPA: hypothetical protein VFH73_09200 [Polyangia bacterium]|nr:hypothetical protein [Polyangia bacterium]
MRPATLVALFSALPALNGCYGTRAVPVTQIASLKHGDRGREAVLASGLRGVRVGPRSWLRFRRWDGSRTPWFEARKLRVNDRHVVTAEPRAHSAAPTTGIEGLDWALVAGVEVNELDLEESLVGITAGTAAVLAAMMTEAFVIGVIGALSGGHLQVNDLGITRGALESVAGEALKRPDEDPAARSTVLAAPTTEESPARPLFSPEARRRDLCLVTVSSEGGIDGARTFTSVGGVAVGLRLVDLFELGVGARSSLLAPTTEGEPFRLASVPFVRFGLHLDLTAGRRVALAVGADLGGASGKVNARFLYGLRVRLTDKLQLGLYPWNPVATSGSVGRDARSRLNLIELSWLL